MYFPIYDVELMKANKKTKKKKKKKKKTEQPAVL